MQTKEDLRALFAELLHQTFQKHPEPKRAHLYRLMHTSGTTGLPLPMVYRERPDWNERSVFLGFGKRIIMAFGSKSLRLDFARTYEDTDTPDVDVLYLSPNTEPELMRQVWDEFRPTAFVCPPSVLLRLTSTATTEDCGQITSLVIAGELASKEVIDKIKERFPNANLVNTYSSMESGSMGISCPQCAWNEFHAREGVTFEIDDPDKEGVGDLLVSKNNSGAVKLDRYKIGDVASLSSHDEQPTIKLHGRRGFDYIKLAEVLLIREEFDRVMNSLSKFVKDYKAAVHSSLSKTGPQHKLKLYVVPSKNAELNQNELKQFLLDEFPKRLFVTPNSTLADAIATGIFTPLEIEIEKVIIHTTTKPQRLYHNS